jgi:hypothetical protein
MQDLAGHVRPDRGAVSHTGLVVVSRLDREAASRMVLVAVSQTGLILGGASLLRTTKLRAAQPERGATRADDSFPIDEPRKKRKSRYSKATAFSGFLLKSWENPGGLATKTVI